MSLVTSGGILAGVAFGVPLAGIVPLSVTTVALSMLAVFMSAMLVLAVAPLVSEDRSARLGTDSSDDRTTDERATIEPNEAD
jgi:membrane protein implicated in regulation of membrane protease activity